MTFSQIVAYSVGTFVGSFVATWLRLAFKARRDYQLPPIELLSTILVHDYAYTEVRTMSQIAYFLSNY